MTGYPTDSGARLSRLRNVNVREARFHKDGYLFMPPRQYPVGFFDPKGYVVFIDESSLNASPQVSVGVRVNVKGGISGLPNYQRMKK